MRLNFFLVLVAAAFILSCFAFTSAQEIAQIDEEVISEFLAKLVEDDNAGRYLKGTHKSTEEEQELSDEERVVIRPLAQVKWQNALTKLKATNALTKVGQIQTKGLAQKNWGSALSKLKATGQLKSLPTTNSKWQSAFTKLKASGQLKGATEGQIVKITEGAAQEIAKKPSKWRYVGKALKFVFGASIAGLIYLSFDAMISGA
ncbi:unnamed protein product [Phytophthora lilii]|uniref:RxLR effector protein n=1 Tax=Phytophthora lilii TaxID=2077276 RepID=A0A9W6WWK8_9STRA|nr:unnamed protein product [Phytophthora lilii]